MHAMHDIFHVLTHAPTLTFPFHRMNWRVLRAHMQTPFGHVEVHSAVSGVLTANAGTEDVATNAEDANVEKKGPNADRGEHLSGAAVIQNMENLTKLQLLMDQICHLSTFCDEFPTIMEHYFEPSEVWWYRQSANQSFDECLGAGTAEDEDGTSVRRVNLYGLSCHVMSCHVMSRRFILKDPS